MVVSTEKVISEFITQVNGLKFFIKGCITELMDTKTDYKFHWAISHYYCPGESAGVYYPSAKCAKTVEEAESLLLAYMKNFTATFKVEINEYF